MGLKPARAVLEELSLGLQLTRGCYDLYLGLAGRFRERPDLTRFLTELAYEEAQQSALFQFLLDRLDQVEASRVPFIDPTIRAALLEAVGDIEGLSQWAAGSRSISAEDALDGVARLEAGNAIPAAVQVLLALRAYLPVRERTLGRQMVNHLERVASMLERYGAEEMARRLRRSGGSILAAIPVRILVVDDEPDFRQTCVRLLSKMGYQTLVASNGQEALARIDGEQPDLVVCDLHLPGMDGMGVLRHAGTRPDKIPVILFSAFTTKTGASKALEAGASAYLATPFTISDLEAAVRRALE